MSAWRDVQLGQLCSLIVDSEHKTAPKDPSGSYPLIRTTDLGMARVSLSTAQRVDAATHRRWTKRAVPTEGDLILAREAPVGGICRVPAGVDPVLGQRTVLLRPDPTQVESDFLMYRLAAPDLHARMNEMSSGATVPHLNMADIRVFTVADIPSLAIQRRIAAILSAFDELIAINERRIALLEDLARSLYREWFVHLRFPGHEHVEFVDSELGPIPKGWEVRASGAVLSSLGGGTPSKKRADYWNGGLISWFTPSDLTRSRSRYVGDSKTQITTLGLKESGARMFPAGSVLMTSRATLGVLAITTRESTCNQGFIVIPPVDDVPSEFIYEWLANHETQLAAIATGATFKEITKAAFKRFPFLLPTRPVLAIFADAVGPVGEQISSYERQNRALAATRDLLLPRLVTGRLDISDVDLDDLLPADAA